MYEKYETKLSIANMHFVALFDLQYILDNVIFFCTSIVTPKMFISICYVYAVSS